MEEEIRVGEICSEDRLRELKFEYMHSMGGKLVEDTEDGKFHREGGIDIWAFPNNHLTLFINRETWLIEQKVTNGD